MTTQELLTQALSEINRVLLKAGCTQEDMDRIMADVEGDEVAAAKVLASEVLHAASDLVYPF